MAQAQKAFTPTPTRRAAVVSTTAASTSGPSSVTPSTPAATFPPLFVTDIAGDSVGPVSVINFSGAIVTQDAINPTQADVAIGLTGTLPIVVSAGAVSVNPATTTTLGVVEAGTGIAAAAGVISIAPTAVTPGSYVNPNITIGADGRITNATNGAAGTTITGAAPIAVTSGVVSLNASGVTAGTYTNATVTVDTYGRITIASTGTGGGTTVHKYPDGFGSPLSTGIDLVMLDELPFAPGNVSVNWTLKWVFLNVVGASANTTINVMAGTAGDNVFGSGTLLLATALNVAPGHTQSTSSNPATLATGVTTLPSGTPIAIDWIALGCTSAIVKCEWEATY